MSYKECSEEVKAFAESHGDCLLCGSKLKYDVKHACYGHGDFAYEMELKCPACGVTAHGALHYIDALNPADIYARYVSHCDFIKKGLRK